MTQEGLAGSPAGEGGGDREVMLFYHSIAKERSQSGGERATPAGEI